MRACTFDYAIVRVVPRVERGEFINVGVIVFCSEQAFLDARLETSLNRLRAFAPTLDCTEIEEHLSVIERVCCGEDAGPIGKLTQRERFHWLVAPRSTLIQTSPVHCGLCENPQAELENLFQKMVR
jgi:hypothetical protein